MDLETEAPLLFVTTLSWARAEGLPSSSAHKLCGDEVVNVSTA